jgi:hypothetical protein
MDVASKERHDRQFEDFKMRNKRHVPDLQHRLTLPQFEARTVLHGRPHSAVVADETAFTVCSVLALTPYFSGAG